MMRASALLVVLALLIGVAGCEPPLTPDPPPYESEIRNWYDLHAIRGNLSRDFILMNDLDSTTRGYTELASSAANQGQGWQPVGSSDGGFTGTFDGGGYEVRDLYIKRPDESFVGLFGVVYDGGTVRNTGVVNAAVTGEWAVGVVAGGNRGDIIDCYSTGSVSGDDCVGGLVGGNAGGVGNSYSSAAVTGRWDVGGLAGCNDSRGTVSRSYASGDVVGEWAVGGVVGGNLGGTVSRSYSIAAVAGEDYAGGLVGDNQGNVSDSYSMGSVSGEWDVGGLVGYNDSGGSVSRCYATGTVDGDWHVGGLVGANDGGAVSNSFWDVTGSGVEESDGGAGKTTGEIRAIATFADTGTEGLDEPWDIVVVAAGVTDSACTWNIVDGQTYPFLSWESP